MGMERQGSPLAVPFLFVLGGIGMSSRLFEKLAGIGERIAASPQLLLFLDFDGTLVPIVDHPAKAHLSPTLNVVLRSLAGHENVSLVLISGRNRTDLQDRVGIPGLIYAGNHGLEISGPGFFFVEPTAVASSGPLKDLSAQLAAQLRPVPGVFVEDKGLTTCVHYRQVAPTEWEEVRRIVHVVLANADHAFLLSAGHKVYEIRPRVYWNKGSAAGWIKERLGKNDALAIYLGDDVTDEDAFAALTNGITIRVEESPETAAQYHLDRQEEVHGFLEWLANFLTKEKMGKWWRLS
jgi:trehalose-phosphatase